MLVPLFYVHGVALQTVAIVHVDFTKYCWH